MEASVTGSPSDQPAPGARLRWLPWALVAITPIALALVSWDTVGAYRPVQAWFRLYGTAAVAIELTVFVHSVLAGAEPLKPLALLPVWVKAALIILLAIAFYTAAFVAPDALRALQWTLLSLIHLLFGLGITAIFRRASCPDPLEIWKAVLVGTLGFGMILIPFVAAALQRNTLNWEFFGLGGTNIRQVGFYSVVGASAGLGLASVESRPGVRWTYGGAAGLMLALSFWSGTRGALLAIFVAFAVGMALLPMFRTARAWMLLTVSSVGGAIVSLLGPLPSPLYGIVRLKASSGTGSPDVSSGRFEMWHATWQAILQHPVFGTGAGQYFFVVHDKLGSFNHPHNVVLQILSSWGFAGATCYFALAGFVAWRAFLALRNPRSADAPALLVAGSLLTMSLYEGSLFHTYPTMMFALALGVILAPRRPQSNQIVAV